jgi:ketosteroid isomerase-like protein
LRYHGITQQVELRDQIFQSALRCRGGSDQADYFTGMQVVRVSAGGVVTDNTQLYEGLFKTGFDHLEIKTTEIQPLSDDMAMATGESRVTGKSEKGDPLDATIIWTALDVRENGQWKIRMLTSLPKPPPPPQQAAK